MEQYTGLNIHTVTTDNEKCILKSRLSDLFPLNVCGWPMPITFIPLVKQVNEQGNGESEGG